MRFLHTADWQLGMTRHFLEGEAQPRYSAARRDAVAGLGALAEKTGAEFVVVAGDVFESNQLAPKVISQSLEAMRAIGVPVYLLPGNHDPLDASSVYTSALFKDECPDNVVVLDREGVWDVRPGVQLVAAPWRSKAPTTDLVGAVLPDLPADGTTRIVLAHGGVDILDPDPTKASLIRMAGLSEALDRGAVHYVALGDKHSRTCVGDSGRIWYSGSPEVTNYDHVESDPGHVLVVDVDEDDPAHRVSVEAHHVGRWRFLTLHRPVMDEIRERIGPTLLLAATALLLSVIMGLAAGVVAAAHRRQWQDRVLTLTVLLGISTPQFWLALLLILVFAVWLRWLPVSGMFAVYGGGDPADLLQHLVLPAASLAVVVTGVLARLSRGAMLEELSQDYVRMARAKGLTERSVIYKHAFLNMLGGTVPVIGLQAGFLLGGAVYIETVFQWPGMGRMLVDAIATRDLPLAQGGVLVMASAYVLVNLLADVVQHLLDPRIRLR